LSNIEKGAGRENLYRKTLDQTAFVLFIILVLSEENHTDTAVKRYLLELRANVAVAMLGHSANLFEKLIRVWLEGTP